MRLIEFIDNFDNSGRVQILNGNNLLFDGSVYDFNTLLNSEVVEGGASCEEEYVRIRIAGLRERESKLMDLFEQRHIDEYIPVYDENTDCWCVQTRHGFEKGDIDYVAAEFSGTGLIYHFVENGKENHVHGFGAVLERIIANPEGIEIETGYNEYSENELQFAQSVKQAVYFVKTHNRPMTNAELRENRKSAINSVEEIGVLNVDLAYAKWLTTILKTYMKHNVNDLATELSFEGKQYTIEDAVNEIVSIADEYISLRHDAPDLKTERDLLSNFKYAGRLFTEVMPHLWL